MIETSLWSLRLKSFAWSILGVAITGVLGFLMSDQFGTLLTEFTGTGIAFVILKEVITGLMLHLRNKGIIKEARELGREGIHTDKPLELL